jgi:hypothetical protein
MKRILLSLVLVGTIGSASAQVNSLLTLGEQHTSLFAGVGYLGYIGEFNEELDQSRHTSLRTAFTVGVDHRFSPSFSGKLTGMFGTVSNSTASSLSYTNFESSVTNISIQALYHLDNDNIIKSSSMFAPYVGVGIGYMLFDPMTDQLDANGNQYYYWADGSIRDVAASSASAEESVVLSRDYEYESPIVDSAGSFDKNGFAIPLEIGLKFKLGNQFTTTASFTYAFTTTDYLDGNATTSGNDSWHYWNVALHYNFGSNTMSRISAKDYEGVEFGKIVREDADGDGVNDINDECGGTAAGVKVNGRGCPADTDKDGVPDHLDHEPNSSSTRVDVNGVHIPEDGAMPSTEQEIKVIKTETDSEGGND